MALVRFRPRRDVATWPAFPEVPTRLGQAIEQLFDDAAEGLGWSPSVDIIEHEGELRLTAELPGTKRDDVQVEVVDGMLHVRGEKRVESESKQGTARLIERSYGAFDRCFRLPRSVDPDKVTAEFTDGVLTVHMPKAETAMGRKVEITTT